MRSTSTLSADRIELQLHVNAMLTRTDECECVGFIDEPLQTFDVALGLAGAHEVTQTTDDLASANGLLRRFVQRFLHHIERFAVGLVVEEVARALAVAGDGGQRLIELVRQR